MKIYSPTITGSAANTNIVTTTITSSMSVLSSSFANTASFVVSSSNDTAQNARLSNIESVTGSYALTSSFNAYTASNDLINATQSTRLSTIESVTGSYALTSSFDTYTASNDLTNATQSARLSTIESVTGSYATTSSNSFKSSQTITGSLTITQDLVVQGSSSIQYITSSQLNISNNLITVNTIPPAVRFGGFAVVDSGSSPQNSGSLLFDSTNDQWIFVHQSSVDTTSSVLIMGPQTFNNLGNETYPTTNRILKSVNAEHIGNSNITDTGIKVSINSNTEITGSVSITGSLAVKDVPIGTSETNILLVDATGNVRYRSNLSLQGTTGAQGATGAQGTAGTNGTIGSNGSQGTTGAQGATGPTGAQGAQGIQGRQGTTGTNGTNGSNGGPGPTGPPGGPGPTGGSGGPGPTGPPGGPGPTGPTGGAMSANSSLNGLNFSGVFALVQSGANTGNSDGARLQEGYGPQWLLGNSQTWHHQVIDGSSLCGFHANGGNYGNGKILASNQITQYYSDIRLKHELKLIDNAVSKVNSLNGYTYKHNELGQTLLGENPYESHVGLLAQEVELVLPEVVTIAPFDLDGYDEFGKGISRSGENYLTIRYERMVPLLIEAIKELSAENNTLKEILQRNNIQ